MQQSNKWHDRERLSVWAPSQLRAQAACEILSCSVLLIYRLWSEYYIDSVRLLTLAQVANSADLIQSNCIVLVNLKFQRRTYSGFAFFFCEYNECSSTRFKRRTIRCIPAYYSRLLSHVTLCFPVNIFFFLLYHIFVFIMCLVETLARELCQCLFQLICHDCESDFDNFRFDLVLLAHQPTLPHMLIRTSIKYDLWAYG